MTGGTISGDGKAILTLSGDGMRTVSVRQIDAAGNPGGTHSYSFTLLTTGPTITFDHVEGARDPLASTYLGTADVVFTYDGILGSDSVVSVKIGSGQYVVMSSAVINTTAQTITLPDADVSGDPTIAVQVTDLAGNASTPVSVAIDGLVPAVTTATVSFSSLGSHIRLTAFPDEITGFSDASTLTLETMSTGTAAAAPGTTFEMYGSIMTLDQMPTLDLYRLSWTDDTFAAANSGTVTGGKLLFVGGKAGNFSVDGFVVSGMVDLVQNVDASIGPVKNIAYIGQSGAPARINTGAGNDLIVDNGAKLTIVFDSLATSAHDVILGFDTGSDTILLSGAASSAVDKNSNGVIDWVTANEVDRTAEAVRVNTGASLSTSQNSPGLNLTLADLNSNLDVDDFLPGDGLLILAQSHSQGFLFHYLESDGMNGISASELTVIAAYDGGPILSTDILLMGA